MYHLPTPKQQEYTLLKKTHTKSPFITTKYQQLQKLPTLKLNKLSSPPLSSTFNKCALLPKPPLYHASSVQPPLSKDSHVGATPH